MRKIKDKVMDNICAMNTLVLFLNTIMSFLYEKGITTTDGFEKRLKEVKEAGRIPDRYTRSYEDLEMELFVLGSLLVDKGTITRDELKQQAKYCKDKIYGKMNVDQFKHYQYDQKIDE